MNRSDYYILASDLGQKLGSLDLYFLFRRFEEADCATPFIRELKKLAYTDSSDFVNAIQTSTRFTTFLKDHPPHTPALLRYAKNYYLLRKACIEYTRLIKFLKTFGDLSYDSSRLGNDYSPFYSLGREIPLQIRVAVERPDSKLQGKDITLKLFSSGLMTAFVDLTYPERMTRNVTDEGIYEAMKSEITRIKDSMLKRHRMSRPEYAYYYYDRHRVSIMSLQVEASRDSGVTNDSLSYENHLSLFRVSTMNSTILLKDDRSCTDRDVAEWLGVFELALLQRYFLKTRDSYIDKSIRVFNSFFRHKVVEQNLIELAEIIREVQFLKDEGGKYKLYNKEDLLQLYGVISIRFELSQISSEHDVKSSKALELFNIVSSLKREKISATLSFLMLLLNIIIVIDIVVRIWIK